MNVHLDSSLYIVYAAGELESAEREAIRAHLATGCPICAGHLAEAEAMLSLLSQAVPSVQPPAGTFAKIEHSIRAGTSAGNIKRSSKRGWLLLTHAACGAIAALITIAVIWRLESPTRELVRSKDLQLVQLAGSEKQPKASGHVLWDQTHQRWQVTVFELTPPPPGRVYELWFITADQQKHRAAVFNTNAEGQATLSLNVPPGLGAIAMTAITDEPVGGSDHPTGSIQLVGKVPG